ncbi:insulin-degrading enzyme-like 1, peroxisomal [Iris pallida]|uniref:Insulin-degrading enzyme-like 1, peroxisomal n=1 Tax=Iris pallida TaxID=29817 RepID=A0AAX6FZY0_IRIPA|nr:insulin-degrading enzyme-like 1, peroxisomal [Iris pallida]
MAVGKSEVEILKPRTDAREYRRIVLANSLEALLISDPETDKVAASMNVSVGYFSDPDGLEGLAHFLGRCCRSLKRFFGFVYFLFLCCSFSGIR